MKDYRKIINLLTRNVSRSQWLFDMHQEYLFEALPEKLRPSHHASGLTTCSASNASNLAIFLSYTEEWL
jgi:hypothetical protein